MPETITLEVHVTPKAAKAAIGPAVADADGVRYLKVRVTAAADGGKANLAVVRLLAGALRLAPSRITLVRGATARRKVLRLEDLSEAEADEVRRWLA